MGRRRPLPKVPAAVVVVETETTAEKGLAEEAATAPKEEAKQQKEGKAK